MDLGKPITAHTVPTGGFDQGEHGAGTGLSGGHGHATSQNTQSGSSALGTGSASGGLPTGHPIADKFTHQGQGANSVAGAYAGGGTDDALTGQSNAHRTGAGVGPLAENLQPTSASAASGAHHGHSHTSGASGIPQGVSGAYAGSGAQDALTGESHAQRTGAGVGPLGENLGHHSSTNAALAGTGGGAAAAAGAAYGTGVGAQGGAGGHYSAPQTSSTGTNTGASGVGSGGLASGTGAAGSQPLDAQRAGAQAHNSGENVASKLGVATAGAGAAGAGASAAAASGAGGAGHYGTATADPSRGAPVSDPKELDHGGRHGLVFQESTGKYVHRHEVEEGK